MSPRRVARDLLPLPHFLHSKASYGNSRSALQARGKDAAVVRVANEAVDGLNFLWGARSPSSMEPSVAQQFCMQDILDGVRGDPPPPDLSSPKAALAELLGSQSSAYSSEGLSCVADYSLDLVSWPTSAGNVDLLSVLEGEDRECCANISKYLSTDTAGGDSAESPPPYWDSTLRSDRSAYVSFARQLLSRNMVSIRRSCSRRVGIFFVKKKNGKIRIVIDARVVNRDLPRPPRTRLASTAAVVELRFEDGETASFSAQDIADCFYQFRIPENMQELFGLKPIRAQELGISHLDGVPIAGGTWLELCLSVLPMGFSFALHWTQQGHRCLLRRAGVGGIQHEMLDKAPPPSLSAKEPARLVYVDNQLFASVRTGASSRARRQVHKYFSNLAGGALPLHDIEDEVSVTEQIGLELDGVRGIARLSLRRRWRLRQALQGILDTPFLSGKQLEIILGHVVHALMLNRPAVAVLRACYDYIQRKYFCPGRLWKSVQREIRATLGLLQFAKVDWRLPWHATVSVADASTTGYACLEASCAIKDVAAIGAWSD